MVIFDPLSQEQLTHIVEIQIAQLAQRLAARCLIQQAKKLLSGEVRGGSEVHVDVADGGENLDISAS
ncbi:heat-shock protein [Corynebacterium diphtheriae bv. gravis]|nr:heat-shock protein [Corynebacterium diphtheriae]MBG9344806.1 heat-shock protein [Corynebacterium diphtheriae bv. gravis]MBG9352773.1 heat-shock protein [Corynebacterium diphtheriae bv. gravis]ODS20828.1 heat-shock protein [Corynebacterium diphtheriae]OLN12325.1 heat-shock protein [Corynebacterium diphtheriae]QBY12061.1 heat-shock protein [Corynebacterium diphtheriae]